MISTPVEYAEARLLVTSIWETLTNLVLLSLLSRGFKPISKAYFATASSKASEQFIYFISLVSWLLAVNQHQVTGWNKYDDPMTAS